MKRTTMTAALAALAVTLGSGTDARADSYAYASQTLSNFEFSGATIGELEYDTLNTAVIDGGNPSGSDARLGQQDALQAYVGPTPPPAQNFFGQVGPINPDYARGDAVIFTAPDPFSTANVAETFLTTINSSSGSAGVWTVSAAITLDQDGTVTLSFDYVNALEVLVTAPGGEVNASFAFNFTIEDEDGIVFRVAPDEVNAGLSLLGIGEQAESSMGRLTLTSTTLAAGTYTATITGAERAFAAVVPEPSSLALAGFGLVGLAGLGARRLRARGR